MVVRGTVLGTVPLQHLFNSRLDGFGRVGPVFNDGPGDGDARNFLPAVERFPVEQ